MFFDYSVCNGCLVIATISDVVICGNVYDDCQVKAYRYSDNANNHSDINNAWSVRRYNGRRSYTKGSTHGVGSGFLSVR